MHEEHYTHGWLAVALPATARRFRVGDAALREVLASAGAEVVDDEPDVEIAAWPDMVGTDAPVAIVTVDPPPLRGAGVLVRGARRAAGSLRTRARAARAQRRLRERGYRVSVLHWDVTQRVDLPGLPFWSPENRSLGERLPRRAVVVGRRGNGERTVLEAVVDEAKRSAPVTLGGPGWVSIRAGTVVAVAGQLALRVAVGEAARTQIRDHVDALEALSKANPPRTVFIRVPGVIAEGRVGLADWSLESRLYGSRPPRELDDDLIEGCLKFLVALRRAADPSQAPRRFSELVAGPMSVCRPETADILRALGETLDRMLAGLDRGFAHGDFFAGNLLAADGRLTAVLDWDAGGPGRVPGLDVLHLQLTRQPYGGDDDWGRAVVERLLPSARAGGDDLLKRYCAELGIEADPRLLEALVFAYWLEYAAYQLRAHPDRRAQPAWIEGNIELVAQAASGLTRTTPPHGRDPGAPTRTA